MLRINDIREMNDLIIILGQGYLISIKKFYFGHYLDLKVKLKGEVFIKFGESLI